MTYVDLSWKTGPVFSHKKPHYYRCRCFFLARTYQKTYPNIDEYEPRNTQKSIPRFLILHDPCIHQNLFISGCPMENSSAKSFSQLPGAAHRHRCSLQSWWWMHLLRWRWGSNVYGEFALAYKKADSNILNLFKSPFSLRNSIYVQT